MLQPSLRAQPSNSDVSQGTGLLRRFAPRNDGDGRVRKSLLLIAAAVVACALSGAVAWVVARPAAAAWHEIAWPFPRDGWPAGRAFRCKPALCGETIEL